MTDADVQTMLKFFKGCWKFNREVRALSNGSLLGIVRNGEASYLPWHKVENNVNDTDQKWLLYRERGLFNNLEYVSASGPFTRQYLYYFHVPDGVVKAYHCSKHAEAIDNDLNPLNTDFNTNLFSEGDYFHDLIFKSMNCEEQRDFNPVTALCHHPCGEDKYDGVYDLQARNNFTTTWEVTGPQKSFKIVTVYSRIEDQTSSGNI